jgi:3-phosphoshikimate 1-carboxyvinyltransferase
MNKNQKAEIAPMYYKGSIKAMASKSYLQRALMIAALADGPTTLSNVKWSEDGLAAKDVVEQLGSTITGHDEVSILPASIPVDAALNLNVGESGLLLRMTSVICSLCSSQVIINGRGSLCERPVLPIIRLLEAAGLIATAPDNRLPLKIQGKIIGGNILVDGAFSSQLISGLLITLPLLDVDTKLEVSNPKSIPYLDMTLEIIRHFGVDIKHENHRVFYIKGKQNYKGSSYAIEGDWSGAANHLVGAAISGEVTLKGMNKTSCQADRAILKALSDFGAYIHFSGDEITVKKDKTNGFDFDATHCPDLFPPLVVLAAASNGRCVLKGTDRLVHKESNRLETLLDIFGRLGLSMDSRDNYLYIYGNKRLRGGHVSSHKDHRIAMAAAIAASLTDTGITIDGTEAVGKSYPDFFKDLSQLTHSVTA